MKKKVEKSIQLEKLTPDPNITSARAGRSVTLVGALVNAILVLLKLVAGILGHSQALIADAVHSVSDLFTDVTGTGTLPEESQ